MTVPALLVGLVTGGVGALFLAVVIHLVRLYRAGFAEDAAGALKRDVFTSLLIGKGVAPIPLAFVLGFLGVTLLVFGVGLVWDSLVTFWAHGVWLGYVL
jgi:hypothetical protein